MYNGKLDKWLDKYQPLKFKNYGLKGKMIKVKWKDAPHYIWNNIWMPAMVIDETDKFIRCEVLPHVNPNGLFMSETYPLTINKMALELGEYEIKERKEY